MKIGILTDVIDNTKYHKGVYYYTKNLIKNLPKDKHEFYFINSSKIKKLKVDLDIIHSPQFQFKPFLSLPSTKKVLTVHGADFYVPYFMKASITKPKAWFQQKILDLIMPYIINDIDKFIAVSNFIKNELLKLKIPEEKIEVVYEGVDEIFNPLNNIKNKNFCSYILSDAPTNELFEVFLKLKITKDINHKLFIVGEREYTNKGMQIVQNLGLQKDVKFFSHVSQNELVELYNFADVFVHLTGYEGFGLQNLEAMACGCPVVSSNVGAIPEIVENAGILKRVDDTSIITSAIYNILKDEKLAKEMRSRGLEQAKKFSWKKTAKETVKVYERLV